VTALLAGAAVAVAFVIGVRSLGADRANFLYALGLIVTALLYVVFAATRGASGGWLALECIGVLLYGALAFAGFRGNAIALALGWAGHPVWDVLLHRSGSGAAYTPTWYPMACVGFDLVVAIAILVTARSRRTSTTSS
jgi:hypothetical protein